MTQSIYRHFKAIHKDIQEKIEEKESQIILLKKLLNQDIASKQNEEKIKELTDQLKDLSSTDEYVNFDETDTEHLLNLFEVDYSQYIAIDQTIEQVILLFSSLFFSISTSNINKKMDQWNSADNLKAKRRFITFYPLDPIEYMKALKSRSPNRLTDIYTNERNENKINNLNNFFTDKDLLNVYKNTETLITQTPTEGDIKNEVENLINKKLRKVLKKKYLVEISKLTAEEIILQLSNSTKENEVRQEELEVLAESLDILKSKHFRSEIKKLKRRGLSPEQIWDHII